MNIVVIYIVSWLTSHNTKKSYAKQKEKEKETGRQASSNATKLQLNRKKVNDHHTHISQIYNTLARCSCFKLHSTITFIQPKVCGRLWWHRAAAAATNREIYILYNNLNTVTNWCTLFFCCSPAFLYRTHLLSTGINYNYYCSLLLWDKILVLLNMCFCVFFSPSLTTSSNFNDELCVCDIQR